MSNIALPLARYRFVYTAEEPLRLPGYAGSAWRGAFGRALKRLACVTRGPACPPCLLYRNCLYPQLFETPADPAKGFLGKVDKAPTPFVFLPDMTAPRTLAVGAELGVWLTLIGHANQHLPYVIHALDQAGRHGITRQRAALTLTAVRQADGGTWPIVYRPGAALQPRPAVPPPVPACPARLRLRFLTPFRAKRNGHLVTPDDFDFAALFNALLRRLSLLSAYHADAPLNVDARALTRQARAVPLLNKQLYWREYERYSSRQQAVMKMGGVVGEVELDGAGLEPFWPYLWLGQYTHAGKWADMGLGHYQIEGE